MVRLAPNTPEYNRWNAPDVKLMKELVVLIRTDVADWNQRRQELAGELPKLMEAPLSRAALNKVDLSNCDLRGADFEKANLAGANLCGADLRGAKFSGAYMWQCDLTDANLLEARLDEATLDQAKLDNTNLLDARMERASLKKASLHGAFTYRTKFENSDFAEARGFVPDNTLIRGSYFSISSDDPWSILRYGYTGPRTIMNVFVLLVAILPFLVKAGFWFAVIRAQEWTQEAASATPTPDGLASCLSAECREVPLWSVVIGLDQGGLLWVPPIILILYNTFRLFMTYRVGVLRDAEERSGFSPHFTVCHPPPYSSVNPRPQKFGPRQRELWRRILSSYGWLWRIHKLLGWFFFLSVAAFIWHVLIWLRMTVLLPA